MRLYGLRHLRDRHAAHDLMQQALFMTLERLRAGKLREPGRTASFVLGMHVKLVAVGESGERPLGEYTFAHTPG